MVFRKPRNHNGTPFVALDRNDLVPDGVIAVDEDGHEDQNMHVQRLGKGVHIVRPAPENELIQPSYETELL